MLGESLLKGLQDKREGGMEEDVKKENNLAYRDDMKHDNKLAYTFPPARPLALKYFKG